MSELGAALQTGVGRSAHVPRVGLKAIAPPLLRYAAHPDLQGKHRL
jgi:hypothetical protein